MKFFTLSRSATKEQRALCPNLARRLRARTGQTWSTEDVLAYALQLGLAHIDKLPLPGEHVAVVTPVPTMHPQDAHIGDFLAPPTTLSPLTPQPTPTPMKVPTAWEHPTLEQQIFKRDR